MFIAGAVVVGGIIIAYDDHSKHSKYEDYDDYSDHSNYSAHSRYGDSSVVNAIDEQQDLINDKEYDLDRMREEMEDRFRERVEELQGERYYDSLDDAEPYDVVDNVREEMREELEQEISAETAQLAQIDEMIARINELELQAKEGA